MSGLLDQPLCDPSDLGRSIPDSSHAVSVCLPTWQDNVDYEEGKQRVVDRIRTGYPRFVYNAWCQQLFQDCLERYGSDGDDVLVFPDGSTASRFVELMTSGDAGPLRRHVLTDNSAEAVFFSAKHATLAKQFWQHCGEGISSRHAAACLNGSTGDAESALRIGAVVQQRVADLSAGELEDVWIYPTGMSAIYAVHRAVSRLAPGLPSAQLGFPYVDTLKTQQKIAVDGRPTEARFFPRADDIELDQLSDAIRQRSLSAVYTEFPSNPLLCSPDLARLYEQTSAAQIPLVVDDTIATWFNCDLLPTTDILCTSLTKSFSGAGDVMGGAVVLNRQSRLYDQLRDAIEQDANEGAIRNCWCENLDVLERNSRDFSERMPAINKNAQMLVSFLRDQRRVRQVYYPSLDDPNYAAFLKPNGGAGCLFSLVLDQPEATTARFFDALRVSKGPSLGTNFTLACPYTILAHYNELPFAESCGVSRYLIRVSVGLETPDDLKARFGEALDGL